MDNFTGVYIVGQCVKCDRDNPLNTKGLCQSCEGQDKLGVKK